jgi:hypothetical protein
MKLATTKSEIKKNIDLIDDVEILQAIKTILDYAAINNSFAEDKEFMNELKERSTTFKSGKAKTYSWEETKIAARKSLKTK